eukprot:93455_1
MPGWQRHMRFERLPSDLVSEILIHLPIIERIRLCRTSKLFQFANKKCPAITLDYESFYFIYTKHYEEFINLILLKPTIVKSFKTIRCFECPLAIGSLVLAQNKINDYFECIQTLNIQTSNDEKTCIISDLLRNIMDTKLQYSLQTLIVDKMDFFIADSQQMDLFYNMLSKLRNLKSLTFDYSQCKYGNHEMEETMVNYFLNHETTRTKTDKQILDEKAAEDYDSDYFSETSYNTDWDKFYSLFERLRSCLSHIEHIKIQNIEVDSVFYIVLSICLHVNLKRLELEIVGNNGYTWKSDDELFSDFYCNTLQTWADFGFYAISDFIPELLSLNSLSIYVNGANYRFRDDEDDKKHFVWLLQAFAQMITASEQLKTLEISSWTEILNKFDTECDGDQDTAFDLDTLMANHCISHLNTWKPLFWFHHLLYDAAQGNINIRRWLRNTLEYFEFCIVVVPPSPPYEMNDEVMDWKDYEKVTIGESDRIWISKIPNILSKIAIKCKEYNIEHKILIEFGEIEPFDGFAQLHPKLKGLVGCDERIKLLWIDFIGCRYAKHSHFFDPKQRKICHYFGFNCC